MVGDHYAILVECQDESEQKALYEQLLAEGKKVRPLTL